MTAAEYNIQQSKGPGHAGRHVRFRIAVNAIKTALHQRVGGIRIEDVLLNKIARPGHVEKLEYAKTKNERKDEEIRSAQTRRNLNHLPPKGRRLGFY